MSSIFEDREIRRRLREAFPKMYLNANYELIVYPARNIYLLMEDVTNENDLKAKILEWLSREASKSISHTSQKYHLNGINTFLGTQFTILDMEQIYTYIGNRCNHGLTTSFIASGYDMAVFPVCDHILEERWKELADVPFDDGAPDEDLTLAQDWWRFKRGTEREEIWHFFDENHSKGVAYLL